MIFGLSGLNGAGKGEVLKFLTERSFYPYSLSDVIRERLRVYREQTEPLLGWYEEKGLLRRVMASGKIEEIFERVVATVEEPAG